MTQIVRDQASLRRQRGAERHASIIREFWAKKGYPGVRIELVQVKRRDASKAPEFGLRSNLVNGKPPGMHADPKSHRVPGRRSG